MNKFLVFVACLWGMSVFAEPQFEDVFYSKTLRLDFILSGNSDTTEASFVRFLEEPYWGGRTAHLDSSLRLGDFLLLVQDLNGATIYEEGFATLYEEWQCTKEARQLKRAYPNSCLMPYPKEACHISILKRRDNEFIDTLWTYELEPHSPIVQRSCPLSYRVDTVLYGKPSSHAVDIVILAEGFQEDEMDEFRVLSKELSRVLCTAKVFERNKDRLNFYAIESVSEDSGTDNPNNKIWKNTCFDAGFNTLYSQRYLMAQDIWSIRDAASVVSYDYIYIIVNTPVYGGGGIYNYYAICSAYGRSSKEVLIHEFGHSFAALADEYYYDDEMLINYIDKSREPWQKNITTLVDFDKKWKSMLDEGVPIPTPVGKAEKYPIGVYEGAAYVSKGVYRACPDCRMKTNEAEDFCPVCESAIQEVIDFLCSE